jgi:hypothetical protein
MSTACRVALLFRRPASTAAPSDSSPALTLGRKSSPAQCRQGTRPRRSFKKPSMSSRRDSLNHARPTPLHLPIGRSAKWPGSVVSGWTRVTRRSSRSLCASACTDGWRTARHNSAEAGERPRRKGDLLKTLARLDVERAIGPLERVKQLWRLVDACRSHGRVLQRLFALLPHWGRAVRFRAQGYREGHQGPADDGTARHHTFDRRLGLSTPLCLPEEWRLQHLRRAADCCRVQHNMDADTLVCELVPEEIIPVPYLDHRDINLHVASIRTRNPGRRSPSAQMLCDQNGRAAHWRQVRADLVNSRG